MGKYTVLGGIKKGMFCLCITSVCCLSLCLNRKVWSYKSSRHSLDGKGKSLGVFNGVHLIGIVIITLMFWE